MGRAKKRYYKLAAKIGNEHPELTPLEAYIKAIDIDQREQARLQAERWRAKENDVTEYRVGPSDELVKAQAAELRVERGGVEYPVRRIVFEEINNIMLGYVGNCVCDAAYYERNLKDPNCIRCQMGYDDMLAELTLYVERKLRLKFPSGCCNIHCQLPNWHSGPCNPTEKS